MDYDVALSFAGEERTFVLRVAELLRAAKVRAFFDDFEKVDLWGKDLQEHFQQIFTKRARFCVIFVSKNYASKAWPRAEHRAAQARAMTEAGYVLPVRFDETEVPGLLPTISYLSAEKEGPEGVAAAILTKVAGEAATSTGITPITGPSSAICENGLHTFEVGSRLELELRVLKGHRVVGSLREEDGRAFWYGICNEKNLVARERDDENFRLAKHADGEARAHYVEWSVKKDDRWYLILEVGASRARGSRTVSVNLRAE